MVQLKDRTWWAGGGLCKRYKSIGNKWALLKARGSNWPVDGDHGDGEEGYTDTGVLYQGMKDAQDVILVEAIATSEETAHTPWHHQDAEREIRDAQAAHITEDQWKGWR